MTWEPLASLAYKDMSPLPTPLLLENSQAEQWGVAGQKKKKTPKSMGVEMIRSVQKLTYILRFHSLGTDTVCKHPLTLRGFAMFIIFWCG